MDCIDEKIYDIVNHINAYRYHRLNDEKIYSDEKAYCITESVLDHVFKDNNEVLIDLLFNDAYKLFFESEYDADCRVSAGELVGFDFSQTYNSRLDKNATIVGNLTERYSTLEDFYAGSFFIEYRNESDNSVVSRYYRFITDDDGKNTSLDCVVKVKDNVYKKECYLDEENNVFYKVYADFIDDKRLIMCTDEETAPHMVLSYIEKTGDESVKYLFPEIFENVRKTSFQRVMSA